MLRRYFAKSIYVNKKMSNRRYWMHRISYEGDIKQILLKYDNILVTGWGKVSNDTFLAKVFGKNRDDYSSIYSKDFGGLTRNRFCLYMFLNEFHKGDYVIVPGIKDFSVYEIVGEKPQSKEHIKEFIKTQSSQSFIRYCGNCYYNQKGEELELGFFWEVKPVVVNVPRDGFADNNLQRRLKFQMTNIEMTDLADEIEKAIKSFQSGKTTNLKGELADGTRNVIVDKLCNKINDAGFERVVKWYLERLGATSVFIPAKKNLNHAQGDADVIALFDELRVAIFVQVKQYNDQVDKNALEQIVRAYDSYKDQFPDRTPILWVVTTCNFFSQEAQDYANENSVRCIGGEEFADMILDVGIKNLSV